MQALAQALQLLLNGVAVGAIYALVAVGLVLTYKSTEVLNFAHGDLLAAAAFVGWALVVVADVPFVVAAPVAVAVMAAISYALEARVVRLIIGQPQFSGVMLTIALSFIVRGSVSMIFGPDPRALPTPWTGRTTTLGPVVVTDLNLLILGTCLLTTIVVFLFLRRSSLGVAIQAASQNQLAAYLCGIRVKRLNSIVWAIAGGLAALCGLLLAPTALVDTGLWVVVLKALSASVLGGFGSIPGALLGGIAIGVIEQFSGVYLPDGFKDIIAYLVLMLVLILWPRGLLGEAHGRRI